MGVMSPTDGHFEAVGMKAAEDFFLAPVRLHMSPTMVRMFSEQFCRRCKNEAIAIGFREMAYIIIKQRMSPAKSGEGE